MLKLLLCIDGSDASLRALEHVLATTDRYKEAPEMHLLNVQAALPGDVTMFIGREQIKQFHQEEGRKALAGARAKLDASKRPYVSHIEVGSPAEAIVGYAREHGCDQICLGTRGLGHVSGMLLGSVTAKVIHLSEVPVLLVK
jgi:nucleotide-binding universal stress UspA family protein